MSETTEPLDRLNPLDGPFMEVESIALAGLGARAFTSATGWLYIVDKDETRGTNLARTTLDETIAAYVTSRTPVGALGPHQDLAVFAYTHGLRACRDAVRSSLADPSVLDVRARWLDDYADYLLIHLRRLTASAPPRVQHLPMRERALALLAEHPNLLAGPQSGRGSWDDRYTHRCPVCSGPALHDRYHPHTVCDGCAALTCDRDGRGVEVFAEDDFLIVNYRSHDLLVERAPRVMDEAIAWIRGVQVDLHAHGDEVAIEPTDRPAGR